MDNHARTHARTHTQIEFVEWEESNKSFWQPNTLTRLGKWIVVGAATEFTVVAVTQGLFTINTHTNIQRRFLGALFDRERAFHCWAGELFLEALELATRITEAISGADRIVRLTAAEFTVGA